jgi:thioredoxin 1
MVKIVSELSEIPVKGSVVIDFYANWCGPCKRIAPVYEKLADAYKKITFLKVDVDESGELVEKFGIQAMPTFVFLKDGMIVKRVEGADMVELESGFTLLS